MFSYVLVLLYSLLNAQISINNKLTESHIPFRDQRYLIIPPPDFIVAPVEEGNGLVDTSTGATIILSEIPFGFRDFIPALETEQLKAANLRLVSKEPVIFHQKEGFFLMMEEEKRIKQVLIFGDEAITVVLEGNIPDNVPHLLLPVKEALMSLVPSFGLGVIPYIISTANTDFVLTEQKEYQEIYTTDGLYPTEAEDKSVFVTDIIRKEWAFYNKMVELNNALSRLPLLEYRVRDDLFDAVTVHGLTGYEVVADGTDEDGDQVKVYLVMLYLENNIYILYGVSTDESKIREFRKLAYSFQLNRQ